MPPVKLDRIADQALRESLAAAHASLRSGDYLDVVRRCAAARPVTLSEAKHALSAAEGGLAPPVGRRT